MKFGASSAGAEEVVGGPRLGPGLPFNAKRYLEALRATDLRGPLRVRALVWVR
jgi:hypothetical protein